MKYVKILGLAAIAAMALMAFGVGTASATTLDGNGSVLKAGSTIEATLSGSAKLTNTEETLTLDTCTAGTVSGTTSNETGETISGEVAVGGLTWGTEAAPCTNTTDTIKGGTLHIKNIAGTHNGTVIGTGFQVTVFVASLNTTCIYTLGTETHLGTLTGGKPATLSINAVVTKTTGSGFLCPTSAKWVAAYKVTNPAELTVTA